MSYPPNVRSRPIPTVEKVARDWRAVPPCAHFVQLYREEQELTESLAAFVADGIWQSEKVIIIATAGHRSTLEKALRERGVDLFSAISTQQLTMLDAGDTMAKFLVDGMPDRRLFMATVGDIVRRTTGGGRRLRAFGEMVALLWEGGNRRAAIELENLWSELSRECRFPLFCAYPAAATETAEGGISLADICRTHDRVITA